MKMNETTHCIFCNIKLAKSIFGVCCSNKECYRKYQYGSRNEDDYLNRSFKIDNVWYHYYDDSMRIYDTNSSKTIDLEYHLTLEQIKKYQIFL